MRISPLFAVFIAVAAGTVASVAAQSPPPPAQIWQSATYHGGSDFEFAETFVVDSAGSSYMLGRTFSGDMQPSVQPVAAAFGEPASATFVLKLTSRGQPAYATRIGSGLGFLPLDLAVGFDGAAHVLARDGDVAHVVKLDPVSGAVDYDVTFDAAEGRYPKAIAVDDTGHAVVAGWSGSGLFVARLDARGIVFAADSFPLNIDPKDIDVDSAGDVYIVGSMNSVGLPTNARSVQPRYNAGDCSEPFAPQRITPCADAILMKVSQGGIVRYATYFGGTGFDEGSRVAVDRAGAAVIAGITRSTDLPVAGALQSRCNPGFAPLPCGDAFIAKVDPTGSRLVFATYFGGTDTESVSGLAFDDAGTLYLAGNIAGGGMPIYRAPQPVSAGGRTEGFAAAISAAGELQWSTYVGGQDDDRVVGIGVAAGLIQFGGETLSPAWASGGAPFHGGRDLFTAQLMDVRSR